MRGGSAGAKMPEQRHGQECGGNRDDRRDGGRQMHPLDERLARGDQQRGTRPRRQLRCAKPLEGAATTAEQHRYQLQPDLVHQPRTHVLLGNIRPTHQQHALVASRRTGLL